MKRAFWTPVLLALGVAAVPQSVPAQYAPGKASLGGSVGVPFILADEDLREGQRPRLVGKLHFNYVFNPDLRLSLRGGFGWVGYSGEVDAPFTLQGCCGTTDETKIDQLTVINPFTAVVQYTVNRGSWLFYGGAGPGLYRVNIQNDRKTVHDPVTRERFRDWSPGVAAELGAEHFLPANRNVSFEWGSTFHYLLQSEEDRFPSGYNGNHSFLDLSFGVNVYFRPPGSPAPLNPVLGEEEVPDESEESAEPLLDIPEGADEP